MKMAKIANVCRLYIQFFTFLPFTISSWPPLFPLKILMLMPPANRGHNCSVPQNPRQKFATFLHVCFLICSSIHINPPLTLSSTILQEHSNFEQIISMEQFSKAHPITCGWSIHILNDSLNKFIRFVEIQYLKRSFAKTKQMTYVWQFHTLGHSTYIRNDLVDPTSVPMIATRWRPHECWWCQKWIINMWQTVAPSSLFIEWVALFLIQIPSWI